MLNALLEVFLRTSDRVLLNCERMYSVLHSDKFSSKPYREYYLAFSLAICEAGPDKKTKR